MRRLSSLISLSSLVLLLAACGSSTPRPTTEPTPEESTPEPATPPDCAATQAQAMLHAKPGTATVVEWGEVTRDREGGALAPTEIDELRLMFYQLETDAFLDKICGAGLTTQDIAYVVQEGELRGTASTPFDTTAFAGRPATIELLTEGVVRKYVFGQLDPAAPGPAFVVGD